MALQRVQGLLRAEKSTAVAFKKVNKVFGGKLKISSPYGAWRSRAQQAKLYKLFLQGRGATAAKPGTSMHERGYSLDLWNWASFPKLEAVMKAHGFHKNVPGEPWHYTYTNKK